MKRKIIEKCLSISRELNTPEDHPQWDCYHHFTFIVQKNKIVCSGTNRASSALRHLGYGPHTKMHSEIDAYFKAKGIMDRSIPFEVVNVRLTKTMKIKESKPCNCCYAFLSRLNCKRIWFTTDIGNFASMETV